MGLVGEIQYRPGYSFRNATLARTVARPRVRPWFANQFGGGPMTKSAKILRWSKGTIPRYHPVWNRKARVDYAANLGSDRREVPNYVEVGLGEAPGATDVEKTTARNPLGFLENILSQASDVATEVTKSLQRVEEDRLVSAEARSRALRFAPPTQAGMFQLTPMTLGLIGVAGVAAFFLYGRKKR